MQLQDLCNVTYYWNDDPETLYAALAAVGTFDEDDDLDGRIFYYYEPDEPLLGDKGEFTITEAESIVTYIPTITVKE